MPDYTYLVPTQVQANETISHYSALYGCTNDDIKQANGLSGDRIRAGQTLNIPIGEKFDPLPTSDSSVLDKKLSWFNEQVNDVHMRLYDPNLSLEDREQLEARYNELLQMKRERDEVAEITKSNNGINLVINMKKDIILKDFQRLFPECKASFYDYAERTDQLGYPPEGHPYPYDKYYVEPLNVGLSEGDKIMLRADEFAITEDEVGFINHIKNGINKFFGGRLDGK